jgi:hypothetical protein
LSGDDNKKSIFGFLLDEVGACLGSEPFEGFVRLSENFGEDVGVKVPAMISRGKSWKVP